VLGRPALGYESDGSTSVTVTHRSFEMTSFLADELSFVSTLQIVPSTTVASTPVHDDTVFTSAVVVGLSSSPVSESSFASSGKGASVGPSPSLLSVLIVKTDPVDLVFVGTAVDECLLSLVLDVNKRSSELFVTVVISLGHVHLLVREVVVRAAVSDVADTSLSGNEEGSNSSDSSH